METKLNENGGREHWNCDILTVTEGDEEGDEGYHWEPAARYLVDTEKMENEFTLNKRCDIHTIYLPFYCN